MPGQDVTTGGDRPRPLRLLILMPVLRFVIAVLLIWLALFVVLHVIPGSSSDPVALDVALDRLSVTLPLLAMAGAFALIAGGGLGLVAARLRGRADRWAGGVATVLGYLPAFWLGLLLILGLTGVLPTGGFIPWSTNPAGALASLLLPALALGIPHAGWVALRLRDAFGAEPSDAEVRSLRIGGRTDAQARWIWGYRRAIGRAPQLVGWLFASVLVGGIVVENLFYLPGLGRDVLGAAIAHDLAGVRANLFALLSIAALIALLVELGRLSVALSRRKAS